MGFKVPLLVNTAECHQQATKLQAVMMTEGTEILQHLSSFPVNQQS